jgi:cell division protein ZapA
MTIDQQSASPRPNGGLSQVTVTINGRQFRMACEHGQEAHLRRLAADLDQRIERLRRNFGEIGSTRLTIMAALTLSDELVEMGDRLRGVEQELAGLQDARAAAAEHARVTQAAVAAALNAAAARVETITRRLNRTRPPEAAPTPAPAGSMASAGAMGLGAAGAAAAPVRAKSKDLKEELAAKKLADDKLADEEPDEADADAEVDEEVDEDSEEYEETDEDEEEHDEDSDEDTDEDGDYDEDDVDEDDDEEEDERPPPKSKSASKK